MCPPSDPGRGAQRVVARRIDLSDLSAQLCGFQWRWLGDLPGITAQLEYVASLGVDAIWLSPFFTSPMKDFGYDVADYCDVDPIFGTLADFDPLIVARAWPGLKVIIDQVYSHTSDQHAWFSESRSSRDNARRTGTSGPMPSRTARRRTTGNRCSAALRGRGMRGAASITCTIS